MSDSSPANARRGPGRHIDLPTNDTLMPRREFADRRGTADLSPHVPARAPMYVHG
jgi:hypothetical protein